MIDPRGLTVIDWTDSMNFELFGRARPPRLDDPKEWRSWAFNVIQAPAIAQRLPPDPRKFEDWRDWAMRFNEAVL